MSNEQYLIVSYFLVGGLALAVAGAASAWLLGPLGRLVRAFPNPYLASLLKRLFPAGFLLPALVGFLSVSYDSCHGSYQAIIADRSYLVAKNQQQVSAVSLYLMLAVLAWGIVVLLILVTQSRRSRTGGDGDPGRPSSPGRRGWSPP